MELAAQNHILYNVLISQSVAISLSAISGKKLGGACAPSAPMVPTPMLAIYTDTQLSDTNLHYLATV